MHFPTSVLLLACFRVNTSFVLRLRPMKEIADFQKTQIIQPNPDTYVANPIERIPLEVQFNNKKPQCGPVPFPDFSCEVTTCRSKRVTQEPKIVPLHLDMETTCDTLPTSAEITTTTTTATTKETTEATTTKPATRKTVATTTPVLHLKATMRYRQFLQAENKETTMSTIPFGWDEDATPSSEVDNPVDMKACGENAKCDQPVWD